MLEGQGRRDGRTASHRAWLSCAKDVSSATQHSGGPGKLYLDVLPGSTLREAKASGPSNPELWRRHYIQ